MNVNSNESVVEEQNLTTIDDINNFMVELEKAEIEERSHTTTTNNNKVIDISKLTPIPNVEQKTSTATRLDKMKFMGNNVITNIGIFSKEIKTKVASTATTTGNTAKSLVSKLKTSIVSAETEEALGQINELLDQLFQDVPYSKVQILLGLMLLDSYYSNSHFPSKEFIHDHRFISTAERYMKFASATFGWKFINGYMGASAKGIVKGVTGGDQLNNDLLAEYTGIQREDIILTKWTSSNFDPGHYIAYDHARNSIVLAIRGTFHARDVLSDLVAKEAPFQDGFAHAGILKCAENKFQELGHILYLHYQKQMNLQQKSYTIVVCGHSLGAGVAALFTMIFHQKYPQIPIHCYAYAPPSLTSTEVSLNRKNRELIDTFVFNDDIVPRLCYASMEHLLELVLCILKKNDSVAQMGFQLLPNGQVTEKLGNFLKLKKDTETTRQSITFKEPQLSHRTMLPPGKVFRIYKPEKNDSYYVMEESNPSFFKEIIISGTLLTDHMPDKYEMAFKSCLDNISKNDGADIISTTEQQQVNCNIK
ncbi:hypothetical protein DLAC_11642 [Tieghemostelium lacteum]|uniref:sn-1-specific diacylglycerol lipase n=1 Tax=Tieghemostelium lacteum TaxID=361077 RepID=A0A151ZGY6_TIELA|nr:hypothetical protein DLAC_11642 [Tieghemostelium lacteum]|eukprot:KYQ93248.1 hypothetical protein DLAC_11642 [Tieghemostelium lacteum]